MTAALLTYSCTPDTVGIGSTGATGRIGITFLVTNKGTAAVPVDQISLVLPRGDGATDLLAANSTIVAGSVRSSNGDAWTASVSGSQVVLLPVKEELSRLENGDILQFTLSDLQVNASGAGQDATALIGEYIHDRGLRNAQIEVHKVRPQFHIESFYLDQYNVAPGSPVVVTWNVVGALSCEVTANIVVMARPPHHRASAMDPAFAQALPCSGTIGGGTELRGSHACMVHGATLFNLTARGRSDDGDVTLTAQLLVTVNEAIISFSAFPPAISLGEDARLTWRSANAGKLVLYTMPDKGQHTETDLSDRPSGQIISTPGIGTRYSLCAFNGVADKDPAKQIERSIAVEKPAWKSPPVASASPTSVPYYPGDSATLSWDVQNVEHCRITCDLPGFVPMDGLLPKGSQVVVLPDPGVANGPATFTITPVAYGGMGDFEAKSVAVPITNVPSFLSLKNPDPMAPGAEFDIVWEAVHADEGWVVATFLPGDVPQAFDPKAGRLRMTMPDLVLPAVFDYTLTLAAKQQKYKVSKHVHTYCTGAATTIWCGEGAADDTICWYLPKQYPVALRQRIRKVVLEYVEGVGVSALRLWYQSDPDTAPADFVLPDQDPPQATKTSTLTMQPGECLKGIEAIYQTDPDKHIDGALCHLTFLTSLNRTVEIGTNGPSGVKKGPCICLAPSGQQIIAINWAVAQNGAKGIRGIAAVCVTGSFGQ